MCQFHRPPLGPASEKNPASSPPYDFFVSPLFVFPHSDAAFKGEKRVTFSSERTAATSDSLQVSVDVQRHEIIFKKIKELHFILWGTS